MRSLRYWYVLLLFAGWRLPATSQPLLFENYSAQQGLSQHNCTSISQDNNGFIWIATIDGLNRYDGQSFKVYLQQNDIGRKLPSNAVFSLHFDSTWQMLWIGTARGISLYVTAGDSLAKPSELLPYASLLDSTYTRKIMSFSKHEYWILTTNNGLIYLNTKKQLIQHFFDEGPEKYTVTDMVLHRGKLLVALHFKLFELEAVGIGYESKPLHSTYTFPQIRTLASTGNRLWVGTISRGCYFIDQDPEKTENIVDSDLVFGGVEAMAKGNNQDLWIFTRGSGIYRINTVTGLVDRAMQNQFDQRSPLSNFGACIFTDKQGLIWLGASGGVIKYDTLNFQFLTINGASSLNGTLTDNAIYSMLRTRDGSHFVGTQGKGLFQWDTELETFRSFPASAIVDKANNVIYSITEDEQGEIWSATCGGLMQLNRVTGRIRYFPGDEKNQPLNKMYAVIKLKQVDSLLVGADDGLQLFSLQSLTWVPDIKSLQSKSLPRGFASLRGARNFYEDDNGIVWVCTEGIGLAKFSYLNNELEVVEPVNKLARGVKYVMRNGRDLLIATNNGLLIYDDVSNKVRKQIHFRQEHESNVCHAIQRDQQGFFWISSNHGLFKLDTAYQLLQEYNTGNGLSFSEFIPTSTLADPDGRLYFGGMDGITVFYPHLLKSTQYSPTPVITSIRVNSKELREQQNPNLVTQLRLSYKENFVTIRFAVPNYSKEKNCKFSYRLKGLNDQWSPPSRASEAVFTSVPPGYYEFELRSANSDGNWSMETKKVFIQIQFAWWQHGWLHAGVVVAFLVILSFLYRRRIAKVRQEALLKSQMAEIEIKGLHTQMNPHFIFNALNSIKEMIWKDDKRNASRYLSKFALLIRTSLEHSRQPFISIQQCIDHLEQYLAMEKLRFDEFSYRIETDEELLSADVSIAPMLVQPLVENAIWHGLRNKKQDRQLVVRFFRKEEFIICEVDDNGVGIRQTLLNRTATKQMHSSVGIENIRERLAVLNEKYRMNCSLYISDKSDLHANHETGTLAILELSV